MKAPSEEIHGKSTQ